MNLSKHSCLRTLKDALREAGTNPVYLAKRGFDVTALDISNKAMEYSKEKAHEAEVEVILLVGDFLSLPFKGEPFDFGFDFGCFHHVQVNKRITFVKGGSYGFEAQRRAHFVPEVLANIVRSFLINARACNVTIWTIKF